MDAREMIAALEPMAIENGLELVDIELVNPGKSPTVRVFLDSPGGISFDQIMEAHEWVDAFLEEADPFPGAYTLEVSSPGIDRHLRTRGHFERFAGETVVIKTNGIPGRSSWTGLLKGMSGDDILLEIDGEEFSIPFDQVMKAHVKATVDFTERKDS